MKVIANRSLFNFCIIPSVLGFSSRFPLLSRNVIIPSQSTSFTSAHNFAATTLYNTALDEDDINSDGTLKSTSATPFPESSHEELMYALGVNLARQLGDIRPLVENGTELSHVAKGILDCIVGRLEEEAQMALLSNRGKELNELIVSRADRLRKKVEDMGRGMLKQMSETEGTLTLDSGVVVHYLEPGPEGFGNGVRPTLSSSVKVHYHGTLPDGTVFDSSLMKKDPKPITFAVSQVIPGWKEGLLKMHEGETVMLGIPPEMAYGAEGTPDGSIPGGATLFFKVQLLEVLSAGIGGSPTLLGADGKKLGSDSESSSGLLGADGKPLF